MNRMVESMNRGLKRRLNESADVINEDNFEGPLDAWDMRMYGDYLDSYDGVTPLDGYCVCVGYEDDDEGHYWRSFTPENWEKIKHLSLEEIYNTYPVAPLAEDAEEKNVEFTVGDGYSGYNYSNKEDAINAIMQLIENYSENSECELISISVIPTDGAGNALN